MTRFLNERYATRPNLNLSNTIPENIDILLFNGIRDSLDAAQESNLRSFISRGGNVFFAQNRISVDIQTQQANPVQSNIFSILDSYGLSIKENLVLDKPVIRLMFSNKWDHLEWLFQWIIHSLPILKIQFVRSYN